MSVEAEDHCNLVSWEHNIRTSLILASSTIFLIWAFKPKPHVATKQYKLSVVDHVLGFLMVSFLVHNVAIRVARASDFGEVDPWSLGVFHWNFQPCHVLTFLFIIAIYHPDNNPTRFMFYFFSTWMPDEGWYQYSYEQPMFHLQHFLMVAAPWYYIYIDRYDFSKTKRLQVLMFAFASCILYLVFLLWLAYFTNEDFCGTKCRPSFVAFTGTWWREFLGAVCIVLAVLFGPVPDWIVRKLAIAIKGKKSKAE